MMKQQFKLLKKVFTVFCCICLTLSVLFISASNIIPDAYVLDTTTISGYNAIPTQFAGNLLYGKTPCSALKADGVTALNIGKDYSLDTYTDWSLALTDDKINRVYVSDANGGTLTYEFDKRTQVTKFAFAQGNVGYGIEVSYEVYVGDDSNSLYQAANKIFYWDALANVAAKSWGQIITFTQSKAPVGKYIGIKITNTCTTAVNSSARIAEIGAWGTETENYDLDTVSISGVSTIGEQFAGSLISNQTPYTIKTAGGINAEVSKYSGSATYTDWSLALTDGATESALISDAQGATITYQLAGKTQVDKFAFCNASVGYGYEVSYELYVADKVSNLYKAENLKFKWDASQNTALWGQIVSFAFDKPQGACIGIKITGCCTQPNLTDSARIAEIGVWGTEISNKTVDIKTIKDFNAIPAQFAGNLLSGQTPYSALKADGVTALNIGKDYSADTYTDWSKALTDEKSNRVYISDAAGGTLTYKLEHRSKLTKFALAEGNVGYGLEVSYEVYVADDTDTLYNDENKVFFWDAVANVDAKSYGQIITFDFDNPVGKYVGIRIVRTYTTSQNSSARLAEIGVWGTSVNEAYDLDTTTIENTDSISDELTGSLLKDMQPSAQTDTSLTYQLDVFYQFKTFALVQGNTRVSYQVYAGSNASSLYETAPIFEWDAASNTESMGQIVGFAANKPVGKYIGIKVVGGSVNDIAAVGLWGTAVETKIVDPTLSQSSIPSMTEGNLLSELDPVSVIHADGTAYTGFNSWSYKLTDGIWQGDSMPSDARGAKLTYKLIAKAEIDTFALWQGNVGYQLEVSYKVYVGDSVDSLYDPEHLVFQWDATKQSAWGERVDFRYQKPKGQYIGILITGTCTDGCGGTQSAHNAARIAELAVYGTYDYSDMYAGVNTELQAKDIADYDVAGDGNLLKGASIKSPESVSDVSVLTDGQINGNLTLSAAEGIDLTFEMIRSANLTGFLLASETPVGSYDVYVSGDLSTLYSKRNIVLHYETQNGQDLIQYLIFNFKEIKYIGIRFGSNTVQLTEAAVYGDWMDYSITYPDSKIQTTNWGDSNILKGVKPILMYLNSTNAVISKNRSYTEWTDDKVDASTGHLDVSNGKRYGLTITYPLSQKYSVNTFALYNHRTILLADYEIYVGNSFSTLYNPSNRVAYYNNENDSWAQIITLADVDIPIGKYIGFKFATVNKLTNDTLRLSEIVACGTPYSAQPTNLASTASVNGYSTVDGETTQLTDNQFTNAQKSRIMDQSNTQPIKISEPGRLSIVVDLTTEMKLNALMVANTADTGKRVKSYRVYTADYERDLWVNPKLLISYDSSAPDQQVNTHDVSITTRYLRIEFLDTGTSDGSLNLLYLAAIGMDDQAIEYENQLYNHNVDDISVYISNRDTSEYDESFLTYYKRYLVDNSTMFGSSAWGAKYGKESLNIVFKFDSVKFLNEVRMHLLDDDHYRLKNCSIYLGKSLLAVMSDTAKPVASYIYQKDDGMGSQVNLKFLATQASYLRICVYDSCDTYVSPNSLMAVFTEIEAMGVESYNLPSSDNSGEDAVVFTDEQSRVKIAIKKLFDTDVYKDLTRMTVERTALTEAQAQKLSEEGMEAKGKAYKIQFYNYFGRTVNDFETRSLQIFIPNTDDDLTYLAGYEDGEFSLLNASYTDDMFEYEMKDKLPTLTFVVTVPKSETFTPGEDDDSENITDTYEPAPEDSDVADTTAAEISSTGAITNSLGTTMSGQPTASQAPNDTKGGLIIVLIIVLCVAVAGGAFTVLLVLKRKTKLTSKSDKESKANEEFKSDEERK